MEAEKNIAIPGNHAPLIGVLDQVRQKDKTVLSGKNHKNSQKHPENNKFETFPKMTKNNTMKVYKSLIRNLMAVLLFLLLPASQVKAGCTVTYSGSLCVGMPIQFTGELAGTTHDFDFNGENTSSGQRIVTYAFKTPGAKTITYVTTVNGVKCTSTLNLTIKTSPKNKLILKSVYDQCFSNNLFCFVDSTKNSNGSPIVKEDIVVSDAQVFTFNSPTLGHLICFSYKDQRGGNVDLYMRTEDANGCVSEDTFPAVGHVRAKIGARFTASSPKNPDCDSVKVNVTNQTSISQSLVKQVTLYWGDGNISTGWGPNFKHTYYGAGVYDSKMVVETNDGCKDSFTYKAIATVLGSGGKIIADKDSACLSDATFNFTVNPVPTGATSWVWLFGPPPYIPNVNLNNQSWSPQFTAGGIGPWLLSLTYKHPICGNRTLYDTVLVIGPQSTIEIPFNRINEWEVYQCPKDVMDSVHMKNFSSFYHNDLDYSNDDSTFFIPHWGVGHVFDGSQKWVKPTGQYPSGSGKYPGYTDPLFRQRVCAVRIWDFGDSYAPECTTDVTNNKNVHVNCQYSHDTLPVHYYKSWDIIMLEKYKSQPMVDAIFIDSNRLCKNINIWPSDSFYIIIDTVVWIPALHADSVAAQAYATKLKIYSQEFEFTGPGERYLTDSVDIVIQAGDTAWYGSGKGPMTRIIGPKTIRGADKNIIKLNSKTDKAIFKFTVYLKRDTLPVPLYQIRTKKGEKPRIIGRYKKTPPGKVNFDYAINYQRFRELYYAKIPKCNNIKLTHYDTCHPLKCVHEATKQIALMHANAGGVGSGLTKQSIECLGAKNPQYGVTFILSDLKPGCTFSEVQINFDTFCGNSAANWNVLNALQPGNRPPGLPWGASAPYQKGGNIPSRYSHQYSASEVCGPNGCVTVGIIVGNGVSKSGTKPLCADTQYYDKFACFPLIDPAFEVLTPKPNAYGNRKICKGDPIVVRPIGANRTNTRDLKSLRWELATGNASPFYSKSWSRYVQEDYYTGVRLKDSGTKKIYNIMVQTRGGENVAQLPCKDEWTDGKTFVSQKPDTLVTAIISKWDTAADVSLVWDNIKDRLVARGFDPFAIDDATMAKMIWNNKGTIGQPNTGARGCIDTTGFGKLIKFYMRPDPNFTKIINQRDTNIRPLDSFNLNSTWVHAYTFRPQWAGYHLVSISMTSANGKCDEFAAYPVIVGFAMMLEIPDTVVCQDQANTLQAKPDYRYFNPDPINNGTWDLYDYWRDQSRVLDKINGKPNREPFTKWDWSKADDDQSKPQTIFGGSPWGGTGTGNPWVQLGGGLPKSDPNALYYTNDSGVYTFRNIAGDSTGCMDTITKRLFISRLDVMFNLNVTTPSCNSIIEFFDSSYLFDPCNWAIKNCAGPTPISCDFMREWYIDWGDGKNVLYQRGTASEEGPPPRIAHKYTHNGWFKVLYYIKTDQGCSDTFVRWVKIPGPRPKFDFTDKAGYEVTICAGDSLKFSNLTDSATSSSDWTWFFGDGEIKNVSDSFVTHVFKKPGRFYVSLQQYDSVFIPPSTRKYCYAIFPDTAGGQPAYIVNVLPRDSVRGSILKLSICPGDSNTFTDNSDTLFKSYKWVFTNLSTGKKDSITVTNKTLTRQFTVSGRYRVDHTADYDPSRPHPWCPSDFHPMFFLVDSIKADFDIDSANKPDFCFTRKDINGVTFRWGFGHKNDITIGPLKDFNESTTKSDKVVCTSYDSSGVYWVCFIAKNATGCEDTICKPVTVDLFLYLANVFTPGTQDGKNDTYRVPIQGQDVFEIKIFNRWGERVFMSEDPKVQWNGKVNNTGADCPEGTYFYQLRYRFKGKQKVNIISGSVNLIR